MKNIEINDPVYVVTESYDNKFNINRHEISGIKRVDSKKGMLRYLTVNYYGSEREILVNILNGTLAEANSFLTEKEAIEYLINQVDEKIKKYERLIESYSQSLTIYKQNNGESK